jgi:hypothetical protein
VGVDCGIVNSMKPLKLIDDRVARVTDSLSDGIDKVDDAVRLNANVMVVVGIVSVVALAIATLALIKVND